MKSFSLLCILLLIGLAIYSAPKNIDSGAYVVEHKIALKQGIGEGIREGFLSWMNFFNGSINASLERIFPAVPKPPLKPSVKIFAIAAILALMFLLAPYSLYIAAIAIKSNPRLMRVIERTPVHWREFAVLGIGHDILIKKFLKMSDELHTKRSKLILLAGNFLIISGFVSYVPIGTWITEINMRYSGAEINTSFPLFTEVSVILLYISSVLYNIIFALGGYLLIISGVFMVFRKTRDTAIRIVIVVVGTALIGPVTGPLIRTIPEAMPSMLVDLSIYITLGLSILMVCVYPFSKEFDGILKRLCGRFNIC